MKQLFFTHFLLITLGFLMGSQGRGFSQEPPPNNFCQDALALVVYASLEEAIPVEGDTRNSTDGAQAGIPVCSANWYRDDVWYSFTAPHTEGTLVYLVEVEVGTSSTDMNGFGLAAYTSCDADPANQPIYCRNNPTLNRAQICADAGQTIYLRVWSADGGADNWTAGWGTFRIIVYASDPFEETEAKVLWGDQPGQGDFDGGLNDWTLQGIQCSGGQPSENALWVHSITGMPVYAVDWAFIEPLKSRTACNGSMLWDGGNLNTGLGTCPRPHEGALISPIIDISAFNVDDVSAIFFQSLERSSSGRQYLDYSLDGGLTWIENEINTEKNLTASGTGAGYYNEEYRVPLPGAAGAANLRLRFRFAGQFYWWIVDDVRIIERECNNLSANPFFAMAPYGAWHVDQLSDFAVMIDVESLGACPQTNVKVDFEIRNEAGELVYEQTRDIGTLQPNQLDENTLFEMCASLPQGTPVGRYFGSYTVYSDSIDFNPTDNVQHFEFVVHQRLMSMDVPEGTYTGIRPGGTPSKYMMANYYYIPRGANYRMCEAEIGISNATLMADIGGDVLVYLFEWDDLNGDGNMQFNSEANRIAFNQYFFEPGDPNNAIYTIELLDENDPNFSPCVQLKDDQGYVLAVEYIPPFGSQDQYLFVLSQPGSVANFRATWFAHNPSGAGGLGANCSPHRGLGVSTNDSDNIQFFGSFNSGATPVIRMVLDGVVSTDPVEDVSEVQFRLWPNPVSDLLRVEFDNPMYQDRAVLRIIDLQGRVVAEEWGIDLTQGVWMHDVSRLSNGIYFLSLVSKEGVQTERFIVQH
jgi:hypothetical protein